MAEEEVLTEADIRVKALEDEFAKTKAETKQLMMDIRALLMEACSPLRNPAQTKLQDELGENRG